jgi:hypothetical protein
MAMTAKSDATRREVLDFLRAAVLSLDSPR